MNRRLIYVPVLHSTENLRWARLETLAEISKDFDQMGYNSIWELIQHHVGKLEANNIRVYHDGWTGETLLLSEREAKERLIFGALMRARTEGTAVPPEVSLLLDLSAKNRVILERTEDKKLVWDSLDAVREMDKIANEPDLEDMPEDQFHLLASGTLDLASRLWSERDIFIAHRIDETLQEGELGILFMGAVHDVVSKLPPDIQVDPLAEELIELTSGITAVVRSRVERARGWLQQNPGGGPERI